MEIASTALSLIERIKNSPPDQEFVDGVKAFGEEVFNNAIRVLPENAPFPSPKYVDRTIRGGMAGLEVILSECAIRSLREYKENKARYEACLQSLVQDGRLPLLSVENKRNAARLRGKDCEFLEPEKITFTGRRKHWQDPESFPDLRFRLGLSDYITQLDWFL